MKNITLSVDENVLSAVRRHAAERNSTVNALVREYLTNLAAHADRGRVAKARLQQLSRQSRGCPGSAYGLFRRPPSRTAVWTSASRKSVPLNGSATTSTLLLRHNISRP